MTAQEAVKLLDESAELFTFHVYGSNGTEESYWVKGSNWATDSAPTPEQAWELAVYKAASLPVPEVL